MTGIRYRTIAEAEMRRVWLDDSITSAAAAAKLGLTRSALSCRAMRRNLPKRKKGRPFALPVAEFSSMWEAGVGRNELARHFGVQWPSTITETARRLGLRRFGKHEPRITLEDYRQQLLAKAMADVARQERAAHKEHQAS